MWYGGNLLTQQQLIMHKRKLRKQSKTDLVSKCSSDVKKIGHGTSITAGSKTNSKHVYAHEYAEGVMAPIWVTHEQVGQRILNMELCVFGLQVFQLHGGVPRHKAARRFA